MPRRADAYYWLRPDVGEGPRVETPEAFAAIDLRKGVWLDRLPAPPLTFALDETKAAAAPPHWIGDRIPLVSALLLATLKRAGVDNFQTLPASLRVRSSPQPIPGYCVFNVIGLVDGADFEASVGTLLMEEDPGPKLVDYTELVLAHSRTRDLDMFRLADNPAMLLVHDRVMRVLSSHTPDAGWGFTGIEIELR